MSVCRLCALVNGFGRCKPESPKLDIFLVDVCTGENRACFKVSHVFVVLNQVDLYLAINLCQTEKIRPALLTI